MTVTVAELVAAIEMRHGLAVPEVYQEIAAAGLFDYYGQATWRSLDGPARLRLLMARARGGQVLYLPQVEWYPLDEIRDFAPGTWADGLLPFAGNGAGDHWCWYVPWTVDGRVPVVFYDHELWTVTVFAPDFAGCVYRLLLENFAEFTDTSFSLAELPALLAAYARSLRPYLPPTWFATLEELGRRPAWVNEDGNYALVSRVEAAALVDRQLAGAGGSRTFRATNY